MQNQVPKPGGLAAVPGGPTAADNQPQRTTFTLGCKEILMIP